MILEIKSNSEDLAIKLDAFVENTNTDYFKTTISFSDKFIESPNESSIVKFEVELIKLATLKDVETKITINIITIPVEKTKL